MKRAFFLFLTLTLIAILAGCSKNYQDALPACKFVSATPYGQDSLLIIGQVSTFGVSPVEYNGFAYSNQPNFDITSNQVGCPLTQQGLFEAVIPTNPDSTYYFKCYVANEYGYTVSGNYKYTVPSAKPDSASCSLTTNIINDNHNSWTMAYIGKSAGFGSYGIEASDATSYEVVNIYFNRVPESGVYTPNGSEEDFVNNPNDKFSVLIILGNFTQFTVNTGGTVYVAKYKDGTTTISFCTLTYTAFSSNFPIYGKITY